MIKKLSIIIIFFYILALLQTSFLVHFSVLGIIPNLILISVIFINFFEDIKENNGILSAFIGGFFLDIFSENIFGFQILVLIIISCFIKLILKKYVRIPAFKGI